MLKVEKQIHKVNVYDKDKYSDLNELMSHSLSTVKTPSEILSKIMSVLILGFFCHFNNLDAKVNLRPV